jgi:hypothetical protein
MCWKREIFLFFQVDAKRPESQVRLLPGVFFILESLLVELWRFNFSLTDAKKPSRRFDYCRVYFLFTRRFCAIQQDSKCRETYKRDHLIIHGQAQRPAPTKDLTVNE